MNRDFLRRPEVQALAVLGWLFLVFWWAPKAADLLPIRIIVGGDQTEPADCNAKPARCSSTRAAAESAAQEE
jgi:hypothetical protein